MTLNVRIADVHVDGLSRRYGATRALDEVDLALGWGITGLLGPNGAGKTTLLSILATVNEPDAGRVSVFGLDPVTAAAVNAASDPWKLMAAGIEAFLAECCETDFRTIALQGAPAALGWDRWKQAEERYFLGVVVAGLEGLATAGLIDIPSAELPARMFMAAATEAGLAVASAQNPAAGRPRAARLLVRLLQGLQ